MIIISQIISFFDFPSSDDDYSLRQPLLSVFDMILKVRIHYTHIKSILAVIYVNKQVSETD